MSDPVVRLNAALDAMITLTSRAIGALKTRNRTSQKALVTEAILQQMHRVSEAYGAIFLVVFLMREDGENDRYIRVERAPVSTGCRDRISSCTSRVHVRSTTSMPRTPTNRTSESLIRLSRIGPSLQHPSQVLRWKTIGRPGARVSEQCC